MSSGSESDDDFVPGEPEQLSEEESADDETELQYEKEQEDKTLKRKTKQNPKATKRRKTKKGIEEDEPKEESEEEKEKVLDPEAEKKRQDDLWAMFLDGTDTKPKPKSQSEEGKTKEEPIKDKNEPKKQEKNDAKEREQRIFEFAGETIVVENNVIKEKIPTAVASEGIKPLVSTSRKSGGGISSILGQLNKTNKLSTLEKSKLDWETLKQKEGLQEEIQSHNKGKNGYLDRQDFLQRADQRQYEIERELRMSRRSNR